MPPSSAVDGSWPDRRPSLIHPDLLVILIFGVHVELCRKNIYVKCSYHTLKTKTKQKHEGTGESLEGIGRSLAWTVGLVSEVCEHPNHQKVSIKCSLSVAGSLQLKDSVMKTVRRRPPRGTTVQAQLTDLSQENTAPRPYLRLEWALCCIPHTETPAPCRRLSPADAGGPQCASHPRACMQGSPLSPHTSLKISVQSNEPQKLLFHKPCPGACCWGELPGLVAWKGRNIWAPTWAASTS